MLPGLPMPQPHSHSLLEKIREIEHQARLVLEEMIATPSIHRTRLLHIITLAQQLQAMLEPSQ
jgi:hypothetical protein